MADEYWGQSPESLTVSASPAPTSTVFTVNDATNLLAGQYIQVQVSSAYETKQILSKAGNAITLASALSGAPDVPGSVLNSRQLMKKSILLNGGVFGASSVSDLKTVDTTRAPDGLKYLIADIGMYRLNKASSATADDCQIIAPTTGTGRWIFQMGNGAQTVTGSSVALNANGDYISNKTSGLQTLTLPTTAAAGTRIRIYGRGVGGWSIAQNTNQLIHFGSAVTTTGTGGSLSSFNRYDCVELVCLIANLEWTAISMNALVVA